jgi:uncharacterized protein YneF (UPF0154 family)
MKWRFGPDSDSDPRKPLCMFIQTTGLSVYPVAFLGVVISGFFISRKKTRAVAIATLVVCGAVLLRFIYLGVFTAALG